MQLTCTPAFDDLMIADFCLYQEYTRHFILRLSRFHTILIYFIFTVINTCSYTGPLSNCLDSRTITNGHIKWNGNFLKRLEQILAKSHVVWSHHYQPSKCRYRFCVQHKSLDTVLSSSFVGQLDAESPGSLHINL